MRPAVALFALSAGMMTLADPAAVAQPKATTVKLNKLSAPPPAGWVSEKPANLFRSYQFKLPGEKDGPAGELIVTPNSNPGVEKMFAKWKGEFATEEAVKASKVAVKGAKVDVLDVTGTWKYRARPQDTKFEERPDYRVVWAVIVEGNGEDDTTHVRLSGPKAVVDKQYAAFEGWLKALK